MEKYILALDQETTSSRAIIFDKKGEHYFNSSKGVYAVFSKTGCKKMVIKVPEILNHINNIYNHH
jgi:glycerol kinase